MFLNLFIPVVTAAALFLPDSADTDVTPSDPTMNIVEVAMDAGSFSTLVTALKAAGLAETLAEGGPFTVFAPSDEAFARIPQADLEALLEDKEALISVLTYHVVPGKVYAKDVVPLTSAETVNGQSVKVKAWGGNVMIDDANVVAADIEATNGVIHVIDRVMLPDM